MEKKTVARTISSQSLGTTEESFTSCEKDDSFHGITLATDHDDNSTLSCHGEQCSSDDEGRIDSLICSYLISLTKLISHITLFEIFTVGSLWGFFEEDQEHTDFDLFDTIAAEKEREQWTSYTSSLFEKSSLSRTVVEEEIDELYSYSNPAPSQCFKMSSEDIAMAMEMSCCISGFRIGQRKSTGEIVAQFRFIYSYGSRSHISWYDHKH